VAGLGAGLGTSLAAQLPLPKLPELTHVTARVHLGASSAGANLRSLFNALDDGVGTRTLGFDIVLDTPHNPLSSWSSELALGFRRLDGLRRGTLTSDGAPGGVRGHAIGLPAPSLFVRYTGPINEQDAQYAADIAGASSLISSDSADAIRRVGMRFTLPGA
jgi:hypothetical protein